MQIPENHNILIKMRSTKAKKPFVQKKIIERVA